MWELGNKPLLLILMVVLIVFVVLLAVLGIVFIIALRKRTPIVKVVMTSQNTPDEPEQSESPEVSADTAVTSDAAGDTVPPPPVPVEPEDDDDDDEAPVYVTEGLERVSYNRSLTAKICQLTNEVKDWYSELKNDLLSYETVKDRMSWRHETFRIGRMVVARIVVRGKTLCLLLAVEPAGYNGTKFTVEDVSNVARLVDTPTLYRIKSVRRLKYAKEMIAGIMKELRLYKDPRYEAKDFFMPFEGDMSLMRRGLVKRVVSGTTRTFKIEEVEREAAPAPAAAEAAATEAPNAEAAGAEAKPAAPKPKSKPKAKPAPKPTAETKPEEAPVEPTAEEAKPVEQAAEEAKPEEAPVEQAAEGEEAAPKKSKRKKS